MENLIEKIAEKYDLSKPEATDIVNEVKASLNSNAVSLNTEQYEETPKTANQSNEETVETPTQEAGVLERAKHFVEDHIPGGLKEKAEEVLSGVGEKLKGIFS